MLEGKRVRLRPIQEADWALIETWGQSREALWGPYQRFQLDHLPLLRQAYQQTSLLSRENGILLIETLTEPRVIGFVRYTLSRFPDADFPHPEIGFGITDLQARGKGMAQEALIILVGYLFSGYASERLTALTEIENLPAQKVLEGAGFQKEGVMRCSFFRDGYWRDLAIYGLLRSAWSSAKRP